VDGGKPIRSAGGRILDGEPAENNESFRVFTLTGGEAVATYSTEPVSPVSITGALAVIQVLAADEQGNALGTKAIGACDRDHREYSLPGLS
jgi:hypothetical protein